MGVIKAQGIRWLGHLIRQTPDRTPRRILEMNQRKTKNQVEDTGAAGYGGFKDWELERKSIEQELVEEDLNPNHGPSRPSVLLFILYKAIMAYFK